MEDLWKLLEILAVPTVGGVLWWIWQVRKEAAKALESAKAEMNTALAATNDKVAKNSNAHWAEDEKLRDDLHNFKVKVASEYVHVDRLNEVEKRILSAIDKLDGKLDRRLQE
jgi:hypothetical protein